MDYSKITHKEIIRGMKFWKNPGNGFAVLATHYTADPDKDPERDGREWYENERAGSRKNMK